MIQVEEDLYINKEQIVYIKISELGTYFIGMSNSEECVVKPDSDYYKNTSELLGAISNECKRNV